MALTFLGIHLQRRNATLGSVSLTSSFPSEQACKVKIELLRQPAGPEKSLHPSNPMRGFLVLDSQYGEPGPRIARYRGCCSAHRNGTVLPTNIWPRSLLDTSMIASFLGRISFRNVFNSKEGK